MNIDVNKFSANTNNIVYLVLLIGQAAWVVFMVFANQKAIETTESRSEKRYKRGVGIGNDHENRIRKLEAFANYTKGKNQ